MILDTNGLSALAEGEPALEPLLRKAAQIAIPVIALGEYRYGIAHSRDRKLYEERLRYGTSGGGGGLTQWAGGGPWATLWPPFGLRDTHSNTR